MIGSQNFSVASLYYNRELGILTRNGGVVTTVSARLARDYAGGTPYTPATASADGYSHSYETNGSGYALIYLNGPPPGVRIGGATCTTSD